MLVTTTVEFHNHSKTKFYPIIWKSGLVLNSNFTILLQGSLTLTGFAIKNINYVDKDFKEMFLTQMCES